MRVSIFGPSGKVGRQALQSLILQNEAPDLELVLITRNLDRLHGLVADIRTALPLVAAAHPPATILTSDPAEVRGSALVVIAAGRWPTLEDARRFGGGDPTGRMVQSYANVELITNLSRQIAKHAPRATVIVVTNQSDLMSASARRELSPERVLGLGGIVDSARFRLLAAQALGLPLSATEGAHIIGYHNAEMIPLSSSLPFSIDRPARNALLGDTRRLGATISHLQRDPRAPEVDTGAAVLPGLAVHATVAAFTGAAPPLEEAYNVVLDDAAARRYGTRAGGALSVPIRITAGRYEVLARYAVDDEERQCLRSAQRRLDEEAERLAARG